MIVLATQNPGKLKEFQTLSAVLNDTVVPLSQWTTHAPEETGTTFVENALIKARHASNLTGHPAIADDSGLVVPALEGEPGLYSARYAGQKATDRDNRQRLIQRISELPESDRQAYFYCCIVYLAHPLDPTPRLAEGRWFGQIITEEQGEHGFGYDPIFWLPAQHCTAAQLAPSEKQQCSHRAQALKALVHTYAR